MSLQGAIRNVLNTSTELVALVADRIRPDELAQGDQLPAIIIELLESDGLTTLDPTPDASTLAPFSVVCCGASRTAATELEKLVRETLHNYSGTVDVLDSDETIVEQWKFAPATYSGTGYDHDVSGDGSDDDDWYINEVNFDLFVTEL